MKDLEQAKLLLTLAKDDFKALSGMLDTGIFSEGVFGFHAQQAVEKLLKTWLSLLNIGYPKTHDIEDLLALLENAGCEVKDIDNLMEFNPYAVQFRYEVNVGDDPLDRPLAIKNIQALLEQIQNLLDNMEQC